MNSWEETGIEFDGITTGFIGSKEQIGLVIQFFKRFKKENTLAVVDPVMGDYGKLYSSYTDDMCQEMKKLLPYADVLTPNLTEALLLLYGEQGMKEKMELFSQMDETQQLKETEKSGRELADRFGLKSIVITGVDVVCGDGSVKMGNLVIEENEADWYFSIKEGGSYSGTGDLFASCIAAGKCRGDGIPELIQLSGTFLEQAIKDSAEENVPYPDGTIYEKYLYMMIKK